MDQLELLIPAILGGVGLIAALYYLFQTIRFTSKCPRCGDRYPERVARKGAMRYAPVKAYHCCGNQFYQISLRKAYQSQAEQPV